MTELSRAAAFSEGLGYRKLGPTPDGWARITPQSHPFTHEALNTIMHDGGGGAYHPWYNVPPGWAGILHHTETVLAAMSAPARECITIGEQTECEIMIRSNPGSEIVHRFFNAFFEDFTDNEAPDA